MDSWQHGLRDSWIGKYIDLRFSYSQGVEGGGKREGKGKEKKEREKEKEEEKKTKNNQKSKDKYRLTTNPKNQNGGQHNTAERHM